MNINLFLKMSKKAQEVILEEAREKGWYFESEVGPIDPDKAESLSLEDRTILIFENSIKFGRTTLGVLNGECAIKLFFTTLQSGQILWGLKVKVIATEHILEVIFEDADDAENIFKDLIGPSR